MATIAAAAARHGHLPPTPGGLTTGYDRAFLVGAVTLLVGASLAAVLLPSPKQQTATQAPTGRGRIAPLSTDEAVMRAIEELPIQPQGEAMVTQYRIIHDIIRRDLISVRALVDRVLGTATPEQIQAEIADLSVSSPIWTLRVHCLHYCRFVHGHHIHEDTNSFPLLSRVNPALNPAIKRLKAEHQTVAALLDTIEQLVQTLEDDDNARTSLSRALSNLADHLLQHLDWEEDAIFPTIRRMRGFR